MIIEFEEKLFVTTVPAPTITLSPSCTPGSKIALAPIQQPFPILIGFDDFH